MTYSNAQQKFDLRLPANPDAVYRELVTVVTAGRYTHVETNEYTQSVSFKTKASMMTWGQKWIIQVTPETDGAARVNVTVTPKNGSQALDASRIHKLADALLKDLATALQSATAH
jgi:hypothetical protein